jgi:hypothetical protein
MNVASLLDVNVLIATLGRPIKLISIGSAVTPKRHGRLVRFTDRFCAYPFTFSPSAVTPADCPVAQQATTKLPFVPPFPLELYTLGNSPQLQYLPSVGPHGTQAHDQPVQPFQG